MPACKIISEPCKRVEFVGEISEGSSTEVAELTFALGESAKSLGGGEGMSGGGCERLGEVKESIG